MYSLTKTKLNYFNKYRRDYGNLRLWRYAIRWESSPGIPFL